MIVTCPNCATKFNLPDSAIKEGAKLKCSVCKHLFPLMEEQPVAQQPAEQAPDDDLNFFTEEEAGSSLFRPKDPGTFDPSTHVADENSEEQDDPGGMDLAWGVDAANQGGEPAPAHTPVTDDSGDWDISEDEGEDEGYDELSQAPAPSEPAPAQENAGGFDDMLRNVDIGSVSEDDLGLNLDTPSEKSGRKGRKRAPRERKKSRGGFIFLLVLLALAAGAGYVYLYHPEYIDKAMELLSRDKPEQPDQAGPDPEVLKRFSLQNVTQDIMDNDKAGQILVIQGTIVNNNDTVKDLIRIEALLYDSAGNVIDSKEQYAGSTLTLFQLKVQSREELDATISNKVNISTMNTNIPPGGEVPFVVVFYDLSDQIHEYEIRVIDAKDPPE